MQLKRTMKSLQSFPGKARPAREKTRTRDGIIRRGKSLDSPRFPGVSSLGNQGRSFAILALFAAIAHFGFPRLHGPVLATPSSSDGSPAVRANRKGSLFSAIPLSGSVLASWWQANLPQAVARFPRLDFTLPEDLHITVVYIGGGWQAPDLHRIRSHALTVPEDDLSLTVSAVRLGLAGYAVAMELHGQVAEWTEAVIKAKAELKSLGLKPPDKYDGSFRPHVTFARRPGTVPPGSIEQELAGFQQWLAERAACDPLVFRLELGPRTPVRLFLADAPRPSKGPEYIPVEDLLE